MYIERIRLKKLNNTRELGGFPEDGGKFIKKGRLIRSGRLYKLPKATKTALIKMGVTTVVDLRTEREQAERPYSGLDGVKYISLPILCTATGGITHEKSMAKTLMEDSKRIPAEFGSADNYMAAVYERTVFDEKSCAQWEKLMRILLNADGCVLWYCNQGKDRTGIASMLVEWLLGADEELIVADYTVSGKFMKGKTALRRTGLFFVPGKRDFKALLYAMMSAKPQYITGLMEKIRQKCGTIENYFKTYLHFTDEEIQTFKTKYTQ